MPNRLPDRMSEHVSERMPQSQVECQNICQIECQLVGITRRNYTFMFPTTNQKEAKLLPEIPPCDSWTLMAQMVSKFEHNQQNGFQDIPIL